MVKIERSDGRFTELVLESERGVEAESTRLFDQAVRVIQGEWRLRIGPSNRDLGWLKRACYTLIAEILALDQADVFEDRIRAHGRYARGARGRPNIFQTGLMAIFADDRLALNARDRERFGKQLWTAYRHYVPAEFLIGFLSQRDGSKPVKSRGKGKSQDPEKLQRDFHEWIIERRSTDDRDDLFRGPYPRAIEAAVEERREVRYPSVEDEWN